ncbi:MAG: hypothetical protein KF901_23540 [Myxococcales bacterium]|nr:hypothetical protein [Myxococcales bacterium]
MNQAAHRPHLVHHYAVHVIVREVRVVEQSRRVCRDRDDAVCLVGDARELAGRHAHELDPRSRERVEQLRDPTGVRVVGAREDHTLDRHARSQRGADEA